MAFNIEEVMDMSLDDYIAMSKTLTKNVREEKATLNDSFKGSKFGRRKGSSDDEEEDDDDFLMQTPKELETKEENKDIATDIWKGPDSSTSYIDCNDSTNDLREKLNNSNKKSLSNISAVQYRLLAPNNIANRTPGIPTLLPLNFQTNERNWMHSKGGRRNRGNRSYNNYQRCANAGNTYINSNGGGVINGRVQTKRNQEVECKNFRFSVARNNRKSGNDFVYTQTKARNMIVETPSNFINLTQSPPLNSSFQVPQHTSTSGLKSLPVGNLTPQAEAVLNYNSMGSKVTSLATGSGTDTLKNLLGFQGNASNEIFANRLLEYIQSGFQNPVAHKPVYDMKIQKDIHEIQKKPLLYKCPGGEVVSSDGAGVNCKIIPRTSGVSMNCRFA